MKRRPKFVLGEVRIARALWGQLSAVALRGLTELLHTNHFSIRAEDLLCLQSRWYVTHTGLLRLALRNRCTGIDVRPVNAFCNSESSNWAFKATVYKSLDCRGFVGYGDADPSNVSPLVHGAEMRVAETRAVNRAVRKAYGSLICSVEEIDREPRILLRIPVEQPHLNAGPFQSFLKDGQIGTPIVIRDDNLG